MQPRCAQQLDDIDHTCQKFTGSPSLEHPTTKFLMPTIEGFCCTTHNVWCVLGTCKTTASLPCKWGAHVHTLPYTRWILLKSRRFSQRTVKWHLLGHLREPPKEIIAKSLLHLQAVMRVSLSFRPLKIWNELSSVDGFLNLDSIENKNHCFIFL